VEFLFQARPGLLRTFLLAYGIPAAELDASCCERMLAWGLCHQYGSLKRMLEAIAPLRPASLPELARHLYAV
jgi:hypothetical protein